jgi:uncharacterized repeat protein (TIGR01451 family)
MASTTSPNTTTVGTSSAQEVPGVRVSTKGPERISINETIDYEVIVENRGASEAPGMLLRATVPNGTTLRGHQVTSGESVSEPDGSRRALIWTIDRLAPGGMEKLTLRLTPEKATPFEVKTEWTFLPQTTVSRIHVEEPKLDLIIDGPDEVTFGQTQVYRVRVRNPGTGTANGVVFTLSPKSATPQSQRMGDIPPGKEAQFEIELSAQDRGELAIHGLVTGAGDLRSESLKKIRVAAAELVATLNGVPLVYQNSETVYQLILQNEGTATCRAVGASLRIPTGIEYVGGINDGESKGNIIRWTVPELSPGQKLEYQFRCRMVSTGSHILTFDGNGSAAGSATVSLSTKVEAIADLVMQVNDPPAPAPAGKEVVYEIVLKNRGSKAATQINAVAMYSNQIEPQRAEGQSGKIVDGKVLFDAIDRLEAGQEVRLRIYAVASEGGTHRFRAEVTSGDTVVVSEKATRYIHQGSDRVSRSSNENKVR